MGSHVTAVKTMLRKVLRPLIPDAVMARYRRHQHSNAVRRNVDVYVHDSGSARRWRTFTPNTYRIVTTRPSPSSSDEVVILGESDPELVTYLGFHGSQVVVRGVVNRPSMRDMRIAEPVIAPISIAATRSSMLDVGLDTDDDLPTALRVALDSGTRVGVLPIVDRKPVRRGLPPIGREVVLIMAAVPLHDIGGGSRAAQIAFDLVRRGYHVVYVYRFPSSETVDLGLRYVHRDLEEYHLDAFDVDDVTARSNTGMVIVEAPIGEFIPALEVLVGNRWSMLYDVIDDWTDRALGGMWYAPVFEQRIVALATGFSASATDLQEHIADLGGVAVLAPNAVNDLVFGSFEDLPRPSDLPDGPLFGYHGSLYGAWFDWHALSRVAVAFPNHSIVVIGDDREAPGGLPGNVVFLGLKAQGDLPAYLRHFDVGLVPFEVSAVTHAVSPLKVYEYLACGVPVAAPPLRALEGVAGVHVDDDLVVAVTEALAAPGPDPAIALRDHSWGARLEVMFHAMGRELRPVEGPGVTIITRPPVRYGKKERLIRD